MHAITLLVNSPFLLVTPQNITSPSKTISIRGQFSYQVPRSEGRGVGKSDSRCYRCTWAGQHGEWMPQFSSLHNLICPRLLHTDICMHQEALSDENNMAFLIRRDNVSPTDKRRSYRRLRAFRFRNRADAQHKVDFVTTRRTD